MKDIINVMDNNGDLFEVEVLDIFNVEGFDKDYIMYTRNEEVDDENIKTYVSILKEEDDNYILLNIEDDYEWSVVQQAIQEAGEINNG